jgi:hypothetical protein
MPRLLTGLVRDSVALPLNVSGDVQSMQIPAAFRYCGAYGPHPHRLHFRGLFRLYRPRLFRNPGFDLLGPMPILPCHFL